MTDVDCPSSPDAAGWVMGTLTTEEAERFERHLGTCAECSVLVVRLGQARDVLRDAASEVAPPPEVRDNLMTTVRAEARLFDAAEAPNRGKPVVRPARRRRVIPVVGALALLAIGIVIGSSLSRGERTGDAPPTTRRFEGSVTDAGGGPRAKAAVVVKAGIAQLVLSDMAAPPDGRVYQAWVVRRPSVATPTGTLFTVPRSGDTKVSLPDLRGVERVIVSAEPPQGSRKPTPPPMAEVLLGG